MRILELAEGNPLFAEELLKDGLDFGVSRRLPATISAVFLRRLESFSAEGRLLLSQAAVIGKHFDAQLLEKVSNQSSEAVLSVLRTARELQIIVEDVEVVSSYNFRHALVREALYEELMAVEACPLHRRIAEHLENRRKAKSARSNWRTTGGPLGSRRRRFSTTKPQRKSPRRGLPARMRFDYYDRALVFVEDGTLKQAELRDCQARQLWDVIAGRPRNRRPRARLRILRTPRNDRPSCRRSRSRSAFIVEWTGRGDYTMWNERALEAMGDNKAHPKRTACLLNLAFAELMQGSIEQARAYATASEESLFAAPPEDQASHFQTLIMLARSIGRVYVCNRCV